MPSEDSISNGFEPEATMNPAVHHQHSFDSTSEEQNDSASRHLEDDIPLIETVPHRTYNPNGTNTLYTIILIVNAALGAGLLNFPKAFDAAGGILVAIIVQVFLLVFIVAALNILAYAADRNSSSPASTVEDVMGQSVGRWARIITCLAVVIYCFGTTVTFLITIGDQYDRVFASLIGPDFCHRFYLNRDFTMSMTGVFVILPFCFSKKIDFLKIPSLIGVTAIIYLTGLIVYEYFYGGFIPGKNWTLDGPSFLNRFVLIFNFFQGKSNTGPMNGLMCFLSFRIFALDTNVMSVPFPSIPV